MGSILDIIDSTSVDLSGFIIRRRTGKFQVNPDNPGKLLFENEPDRLIVTSGINRKITDESMLEEAHLAEEMLLSIPCVTELSDMILVDAAHCQGEFGEMKDTRLIFSFKPDVYSYYKAIKMLNNIRHIFFGTIGGCGFGSPRVFTMSNGKRIYNCCLDLTFFNGIRRNRFDGDDYGNIYPIFRVCGLEPNIITLPGLLKESVERMDERNRRYSKLIRVN